MNNKMHINILQIFIDIICLSLTYAITMFSTGVIFHSASSIEYLWIPVLFGMVYIFTMFTCEMYHRSTFTYQDRTLRYVMKSCLLAAVFCLVMIPFTSKDSFPLNILLIYIITAIILVSVQYLIVQELCQVIGNKWRKRAVIIGCKENIQEYMYYIRKTSFKIDVVRCICLNESCIQDDNDVGSIDSLSAIIRDNIIDEVIFAIPCDLLEDVRPHILYCKDRGFTVRLAVDFFDNQEHKNTVHSVGTIPVFTYESSALNDIQYLVKRSMDIIGSFIGLSFTLLVSLFIIPLIIIQTGQPVLRRRKYLSVNGRNFMLYTFRIEPGNGKPEKFISKLLRRTSMDNLPMFWNVLRGDMSLVGSLPIPAANLDFLTNNQFRNIPVKPGLTGTWRFINKDRLNDLSYMSELNNKYIHKWSFIKDAWIIIKTILAILTTKSTDIRTSLFTCLDENQSFGINSIS